MLIILHFRKLILLTLFLLTDYGVPGSERGSATSDNTNQHIENQATRSRTGKFEWSLFYDIKRTISVKRLFFTVDIVRREDVLRTGVLSP